MGLTGRRDATAVTVLGLPLLAIGLHEHAQLIPETIAAPLLMGGVLLCSRSQRSAAGGVVLALAVLCKLAFLLPAVAIVIAARRRIRAAGGLIVGLVGVALATGLAFGVAPWREVVEAQLQVGTSGVRNVAGLLAQGVWNEFPLLAGAAAAVWLWIRPDGVAPAQGRPSAALLRTLLAAAAARALLALSVFKRDSYINVLVVAEPPLLVLAVCGAVWGLERRPGWRPATAGLATVLLVQSLSLLLSPGDPWAACAPGSTVGAEMDRGTGRRRCDAGRGAAVSGPTGLRRFVLSRIPLRAPHARRTARPVHPGHGAGRRPFRACAARDQPRCPSG